ncbi:glycosyltransferase family 2 protein [Salinibacterium soli]|uniref:cellulose synthase (UDP-forming) n=1 Tax=Antiquaquibacter soli TaxID=3064523 RepID=A0ABT9BIP8_9MICO|nr:glycosyltransferase family 2 protein [Protaetiibacter sp. WY-16]MDO7880890.1 glycosyltransferase family 2 protein [Protaetiibacter sp. WY-16]
MEPIVWTDPVFWPWSGVYAGVVVAVLAVLWVVGRRRPGSIRRPALAVSLGSALVYITWRVAFTIPEDNLAGRIAGIVLVVAEIVGLVQLAASTVIGWQRSERRRPTLDALSSIPSVDVYIATYSESVTVLEPTLAGAMGMRYPGTVTVYLCDDGSRPAVKELAERYGAVHLQREDHSHAKAGNLNNAMAHSTGELIVTLDADMIPTADFLEKTVGYFADRKVGFVQAPQAFHNEDAFQYNLFAGDMLPNEQDYFMRTLQPGKEPFNAVMYVGSNTVFRRAALDSIGGFATGVITEDMATGMLLQAKKWRTRFVPDVVAAGLAPENFGDLLTQRTRWARGNIQTARKWNPLTLRGLTAMQKWLYTDGIIYWHFGIAKLVFIVAPLLYLIFGIPVVHADVPSLVMIWLPYFLASFVSMNAVSQGRRSFTWTHIYEIAMSPTIALAVIGEWVGFSTKRFAVTPKGVSTEKLNFRWGLALPHLVLLAASVYGLLNAYVLNAGSFTINSLVISTFWTLYNIVGLTMAVLVCLERPRQRATERTDVSLPVAARLWDGAPVRGQVLDLSFSGARIALPWSTAFSTTDATRRLLEHAELDIEGIGSVPAEVRWVSESTDALLAGLSFGSLTPAQSIAVMAAITASPDWVRHDREEGARMATAAARTLTGAARRVSPSLRSELRVTARGVAQLQAPGIAATPITVHLEDLSYGGARIRSPRPLASGETYDVTLGGSATARAQVRWVQRRRGRFVAGLQFDREEPRAS